MQYYDLNKLLVFQNATTVRAIDIAFSKRNPNGMSMADACMSRFDVKYCKAIDVIVSLATNKIAYVVTELHKLLLAVFLLLFLIKLSRQKHNR